MPSLKTLRVRINSVKSTRKITSAMKMVAASKLRRCREKAEAAAPYAKGMNQILMSMASSALSSGSAPALLAGNGLEQRTLFVIVSSDRGLCGGFNGSIVKEVKNQIRQLQVDNKEALFFCIGKKAYESLRRIMGTALVERMPNPASYTFQYQEAQDIAEGLIKRFADGEFDRCVLVFNRFKSVIKQEVAVQQIIPVLDGLEGQHIQTDQASYEYEPGTEEVINRLLPKNIAVQVYHALLESAASEQAARMTAMDNATRNAGEMIKKLSLQYNRSRQAAITKELIEIISGAEAL